MSNKTLPSRDRAQRFLFEETDIRGEIVQLDATYRDILTVHQYPPGVARLLGEFMAAAVLLATTLKFEGKLVLQARSEGQIPLLMAECNSLLQVRGIARGAQEATADNFEQLLGGGQLAITIDPDSGQRYQGIVPLQGSLAASLEMYFEQSEQLGTRFWLSANEQSAAGMLLQQLPTQLVPDPAERQAHWEHATTLAATLRDEELLGLAAPEIAHRLYHEDPLRLFEALPVSFKCTCSRERTLAALSSIQTADIEELLAELGSITMDCEFCNQQYQFVREDLDGVLGESKPVVH
ncbi:Hsp33 family molecular chaperone HslO [Halioglobus maricola]|uniref:Hsp33 family molecular chaperone HslO n=1 Tax=Halioglobus maricola TaxID=2601894 RepID=A0A5P9NMB3_9GAMM|nr:Hsp33 family molecular chaperone HslO [Halioglobus maricola]QFU76961.1 Hsp33 family molecular chaperone HslO [Halioglobus maricola]